MFTALFVGLLVVIALVAIAVIVRLELALSKYRYRPVSTDAELPTVSVCIPARNEMHAMTECLERVLASDYPKLEIIVLDDSSVDDTSMLITSFAHAGVRFVEGQPLPSGWLGKNNALQGLLDEASGQYVLFLDVDTTLRPYSIRRLVEWLLAHNLRLVSVMPEREDGLRASVFLGTLRYFWLLLMGSKNNPAVSGAAWLVSRESMVGINGLNRYKDATQPEIAIAQELGVVDGSQLIVSNRQLGVSYEKKWTSQVETSIRLLRPLFGSSVSAGFVAITLLVSVVGSIAGLIHFIMSSYMPGVYLAGFDLLVITMLSLRYFKVAWRYGWWLGALHWPYVIVQEAILILVSVIMYARGKVTWKGRPITMPVNK